MNHSAPFALSEPRSLKFDCWFKQRNFLWFPTQLVDANKDNFNAQFKTQKESCFNWLEMPLIYFECSKNPYFRINQVVKKGPVLFCLVLFLRPISRFFSTFKTCWTLQRHRKWNQLYTNRTSNKTYVWRKFACFHNNIEFLVKQCC